MKESDLMELESTCEKNFCLSEMDINFLDTNHVCCGLCGQIIYHLEFAYEHINEVHHNRKDKQQQDLLSKRLQIERADMGSAFQPSEFIVALKPQKLKKKKVPPAVAKINPMNLDLPQLNILLRKRLLLKMGRKIPVTVVSKTHVRCGLCNTIISVNKKFEISNVVRHFNSWHPTEHKCSGLWITEENGSKKPGHKRLSLHDFAVVETISIIADDLQCIWCGTFLDGNSIAQHFAKSHSNHISIPDCNLCVQELVFNARFTEKYGENMEIRMPSEFVIRSEIYDVSASTEETLHKRIKAKCRGDVNLEIENDETEEPTSSFSNSAQLLGKTKRPKRKFVNPVLRQFALINSQYIKAVHDGHWICKLCGKDIFAAVISSGAIQHFKRFHPFEREEMQLEVCKSRLEHVSDGSIELVDKSTIECLVCSIRMNLHKDYNICRGIRHLKTKHPSLLPEFCMNDLVEDKEGDYHQDQIEPVKSITLPNKELEIEVDDADRAFDVSFRNNSNFDPMCYLNSMPEPLTLVE